MFHSLLIDLTTPGGVSVTGVASGTSAKVAEAHAHEFALTLSTTLACDVPLPLPCTPGSNDISISQWDAFRVSLNLISRFPRALELRFSKLI